MKINLIAEIGWNHMGDMDLAEKMIISAKKSGADYCKFQTWSEKNLKPGPWDKDGRREIYIKAGLTEEKHHKLKKICNEQNVNFLTSVFNEKDLPFVSKINPDIVKIPSHEIHNLSLIEKASELFSKVLVSTGAARWSEVENISKITNKNKIVLMHCVSAYPCNLENINFPRLEKLKTMSNEIGYSGHYSGIDDAFAAITLGACYIEKHFTTDKELPGRDNKFAILPADFASISKFRDSYLKMNLDKGLDLQECEKDIYNNYRGRWSK
tara:strand:+ start:336 stop:1139 length:804 start_codon:yes stop_codon:yes gene_type:complete